MSTEKHENTILREYMEKSYRLIYEHIKKEWAITPKEEIADELNNRELN